jgi:hypothetical protein
MSGTKVHSGPKITTDGYVTSIHRRNRGSERLDLGKPVRQFPSTHVPGKNLRNGRFELHRSTNAVADAPFGASIPIALREFSMPDPCLLEQGLTRAEWVASRSRSRQIVINWAAKRGSRVKNRTNSPAAL